MLTPEDRARDFPALNDTSYLNTAAESIPPKCVGDAIQAYWNDKLRGMKGRDAHFGQVEACREVSARMLGLSTAEVSFCSCSSEAYNLLASALDLGPEDEVVVSDLDFPAGATPWLRATHPPETRLWRASEGALDARHLIPLLNERTRLVQVSLVSFYNGHRLQWKPFHEAVRRYAPNALISVDVTQALGRVVLDCAGADIIISSTHKWTLGIHGGCIIGVPQAGAEKLTTHAGGWFHLQNAFEADRFQHAEPKKGAASFSVGMPNFVALYALNASLRYLEGIGVATSPRMPTRWFVKWTRPCATTARRPCARGILRTPPASSPFSTRAPGKFTPCWSVSTSTSCIMPGASALPSTGTTRRRTW